jgi:hypothetical protein
MTLEKKKKPKKTKTLEHKTNYGTPSTSETNGPFYETYEEYTK